MNEPVQNREGIAGYGSLPPNLTRAKCSPSEVKKSFFTLNTCFDRNIGGQNEYMLAMPVAKPIKHTW